MPEQEQRIITGANGQEMREVTIPSIRPYVSGEEVTLLIPVEPTSDVADILEASDKGLKAMQGEMTGMEPGVEKTLPQPK